METLLLEIIAILREGNQLTDDQLATVIRRHNRGWGRGAMHFSKKQLLPYYLQVKTTEPERWVNWQIDAELEQQLTRTLQMKPRRTASGVATITVLTKPWPCGGDCLYCPNDLRMPKSYLASEPACQRAERNYFDPYLQVTSRLQSLTQMGHPTDKVELIVLGGSWCDYSADYQFWFVQELFRALNEFSDVPPPPDTEVVAETTAAANAMEINAADLTNSSAVRQRQQFYEKIGLSNQPAVLAANVSKWQQQIDQGKCDYNRAVARYYAASPIWRAISRQQIGDFQILMEQQQKNELAAHRMVGLSMETRPDSINVATLWQLRWLGCTKVQMGLQSLSPAILQQNDRNGQTRLIEQAFALLRLFGYKIQIHFMLNLLGATPEVDKLDYQQLFDRPTARPDEVKLYPCVLVASSRLNTHYAEGSWQPYSTAELVEVLVADIQATPTYTRVSRMIRDISTNDILAGNRQTNLRQLVEASAAAAAQPIQEIRYREISTRTVNAAKLQLVALSYASAVSQEYFLQWLTDDQQIAGFLRLTLPLASALEEYPDTPLLPGEAMIREVHIYGKVAPLHQTGSGPQHLGLGRELIQSACSIARTAGYHRVKIISAVGTRNYYRQLGFTDADLYQQITL